MIVLHTSDKWFEIAFRQVCKHDIAYVNTDIDGVDMNIIDFGSRQWAAEGKKNIIAVRASIHQTLPAGAIGVMPVDEDPEKINEVIEGVQKRGRYVPHEWSSQYIDQVIFRKRSELTKREEQVADLLLKNKSVAEIAKTLVISKRTTELHIHNIKKKFKVGKRYELQSKLLERRERQDYQPVS